jgi:hypothetical protein
LADLANCQQVPSVGLSRRQRQLNAMAIQPTLTVSRKSSG